MLETFKVRLKAKYPGVNLSTKRIDAIADRLHKKFPDLSEDADHDAKLDELNELQPFEEIAKQDDTIRTLKAKADPKPADPKPNDPKPADPAPSNEAPEWAKSLIEGNKVLTEKLQALEKEKVQGTIKSKLAANDKLKTIPSSVWNKRALPESEEAIEAFVNEVEADWQADRQQAADNGFAIIEPPKSGDAGKAKDGKPSSMMTEYLAEKKAQKPVTV